MVDVKIRMPVNRRPVLMNEPFMIYCGFRVLLPVFRSLQVNTLVVLDYMSEFYYLQQLNPVNR
mgnify:FL=1